MLFGEHYQYGCTGLAHSLSARELPGGDSSKSISRADPRTKANTTINGARAVNLIRFISYSSRKMSVPIQAAANDLRLFL